MYFSTCSQKNEQDGDRQAVTIASEVGTVILDLKLELQLRRIEILYVGENLNNNL